MQVKDIMTRNAETIDSDCNLVEASQKLKALDIGALPVWEKDEVIGVLTDRDISIRAVAENKDVFSTRVDQVMTSEVYYCFESDDILEAARIMEEKSVHRLIVMNNEYEPVGFVSLSDFAVKSHDEHLTWEVLERISEPACPHR